MLACEKNCDLIRSISNTTFCVSQLSTKGVTGEGLKKSGLPLHSVAQIPTDPSQKWPSIRKVFHEKCFILLMQNIAMQNEIPSIPKGYCSFGWCEFPYSTCLTVTCHFVDGSLLTKSHTLKPSSLYPSLYHKTQHLFNTTLD